MSASSILKQIISALKTVESSIVFSGKGKYGDESIPDSEGISVSFSMKGWLYKNLFDPQCGQEDISDHTSYNLKIGTVGEPEDKLVIRFLDLGKKYIFSHDNRQNCMLANRLFALLKKLQEETNGIPLKVNISKEATRREIITSLAIRLLDIITVFKLSYTDAKSILREWIVLDNLQEERVFGEKFVGDNMDLELVLKDMELFSGNPLIKACMTQLPVLKEFNQEALSVELATEQTEDFREKLFNHLVNEINSENWDTEQAKAYVYKILNLGNLNSNIKNLYPEIDTLPEKIVARARGDIRDNDSDESRDKIEVCQVCGSGLSSDNTCLWCN